MSAEPLGPVLVVGAGLLGTSIGLALRRTGVDVALSDISEENLRIASGLGAANLTAAQLTAARLVVVAVPPDHLATEVVRALREHPGVVTDVGSVKAEPLAAVHAQVDTAELSRYVGSHPMAGSERSGPFAASAALFDGRPWAVAAHPDADPAAVQTVAALARACGATPVMLTPQEHDAAVARTSHLPHLLAALVAGRLADAPAEHLTLSGQGVRDVTRVAAGDPALWRQIVAANATALSELLREVRADVDTLLAALAAGDRDAVTTLLDRGVAGTAVIPGKHGGPTRPETSVYVAVPDHPGELARLLADAGEIGVNIEDLRIDHDPGRPVGLVELLVAADAVDHLLSSLADRGWTAHR
ncbi:prephenate dehydrogenase [Nocardioides mesophilus]|uniref:Prephenate dehydrogenase n=1 Tax=Nocardioides mesophilus TaxID=433659 RepID=A0A7G9RAK5_9ACTN|nr:prephenate dehydrogenase [Nocardioides mesophilus]QNN52630.1 prephenate dehydrogenase [Nocardioides mesophilus]